MADRPTFDPGTMRLSQALETLTGADIFGIEERYGRNFDDLSGIRLLVALIATTKRRSGLNAADAFRAAQELPLSELNTWFLPETDQLDDQDHASSEDDAGKA